MPQDNKTVMTDDDREDACHKAVISVRQPKSHEQKRFEVRKEARESRVIAIKRIWEDLGKT